MKLIQVIILLIITTISGCAGHDYHQLSSQTVDDGLSVHYDKPRDILCYIYHDDDGNAMTCLQPPRP